MNSRNTTVDIMKGIAILLMVIGHLFKNEALHTFIWSFHVPLFFAVSGYFTKRTDRSLSLFQGGKQLVKSMLRRLIVPYFVVCILLIFWFLVKNVDFLKEKWFDGLYLYGGRGPIWFLFELFWCRLTFYFVERIVKNKWWVFAICCIIGLSAKFVLNYFECPYFVFQGIIGIVFYCSGWLFRQLKINGAWLVCLGILLWIPALVFSFGDVWECNIYLFFISAFCSCGAIYVVSRLSKVIDQHTIVIRGFLSWCGLYSMVILCMHSFEMWSGISETILNHIAVNNFTPVFIVRLIQIIMTLLLSFVCTKLNFLRKIFCAK